VLGLIPTTGTDLSAAAGDGWPVGFTCCVDRRENANGSSVSARPFHRFGVSGGVLLQVVCSAQCPPCNAPRSRREADGDAESSQKGKAGLASYRQRRVFHGAFGGNSHPIGPQAQGSGLPAWELSSPPSERRSSGQAQEPIVACASRSNCQLRRSETSCHAAMRMPSLTSGMRNLNVCVLPPYIRPCGSSAHNSTYLAGDQTLTVNAASHLATWSW
jgi:hypothetical protein